MTARRARQTGFTLLEVLVALAIAAFSLAALWKGLSQGLALSQGLPDRVAARWVAQNRIILRQALNEWPETRRYTGSQEMGGREWYWEEQVAATEEPALRRVVVRVGTEPGSVDLYELEGYLKKPVATEPSLGADERPRNVAGTAGGSPRSGQGSR